MHRTTKPTLLTLMICLIVGLNFLSSCKDDDGGDPDPGLSITAITPATARAGEEVVITGTGFNADFTQNAVKFTATAGEFVTAAVKSGNATSLTVDVPEGAQDGPIQVTANGETVTSTMEFTLDTSLGAPVLTSLSPTNGYPGTEVVITGENFGEEVSAIEVLFGETEAAVSALTSTSITTVVPEGMEAGEVQVSVSRGGTSASTTLSYVINEIPVDVKTVYWTNLDGIYRGAISETGATITLLYDKNVYSEADNTIGIEVDAEGVYIYWSTYSSGVYKAPANGEGPIEQIVQDNNYDFYDIALDAENEMLYFLAYSEDYSTAYINKVPTDGSASEEEIYSFSTEEIGGVESIKLYVSGDKIYWTDGFYLRVMEGSIEGSTDPQVLFDDSDGLNYPSGIAVDSENGKIYIADYGVPLGATDQILIGNLDGSGALSTLVAAGDNVKTPYDMEIDLENGYVFWMNLEATPGTNQSQIMRASLDGSSVELLFDGFEGGAYFDLEIGEVLPE